MGPGGSTLLLLCLAHLRWAAAATEGQEAGDALAATKYGQLKGKQLRVKGTDSAVNAYFGIPFAKPPLGALRFSPPEPAEPWSNVRDATAYPPMCIQDLKVMEMVKDLLQGKFPTLTISEDCLYLNIYTPAEYKKEKLPVMVWIHGGGLSTGGASMYGGSALSAYENVVVVTIQYRLGTLGYFSTGDEHAPGNWGFLDQVAALQWVQENIEHFGGDPDSVTIFGESAGGVSVSSLVLSPLAKGLFHKAISESGVSILPGLICTNREVVVAVNHMIANVTGCETTDSAAIVSCMRKKTVEEILKPALNMQILYIPAVTDGVFFPKDHEELLTGLESNPVPFIIGMNNHESGWVLPTIMNISGDTLKSGFDRKTMKSFMQVFTPLLGSLSNFIDLVIDEYLGDTEDPILIRDSYLDMIGDIIFVYPAIRTASYHRDAGAPVYFYEFQHRPSQYGDSRPGFVKADHGDEIGFVFGGPFLDGEISILGTATDEEKDLSRTMMKYWTNFARNGDPNGDGLPEWPVYGLSEKYLEINLQPKIGKQLKDDKMTFWSKRLPEKINAITAEKKEHIEL